MNHLPKLALKYNTGYSRSIKRTPFEAVFCKKATEPLRVCSFKRKDQSKEKDWGQAIDEELFKLRKAGVKSWSKRDYDKYVHGYDMLPGVLVWWNPPDNRRKFEALRCKYEVTERLGSKILLLRNTVTGKKSRAHIRDCKVVYGD